MVADYLEHAVQFESMAAEATDPALKARFPEQATTYHKLAADGGSTCALCRQWQNA
jgi:hypothetical protein